MCSLRLLPLVIGLLFAVPAVAQEAGEPELLEDEETKQRQIYGYVDHQGAWHFVDSLALVPAVYRAQARGNAVGVLASEEEGPPKPVITRRRVVREEEPQRTTSSQTAAKRKRTIADLRERRLQLLESIAILEEGSAPAALVDENPNEALTDARLEQFLTDTEDELAKVDATLLRLVAAELSR